MRLFYLNDRVFNYVSNTLIVDRFTGIIFQRNSLLTINSINEKIYLLRGYYNLVEDVKLLLSFWNIRIEYCNSLLFNRDADVIINGSVVTFFYFSFFEVIIFLFKRNISLITYSQIIHISLLNLFINDIIMDDFPLLHYHYQNIISLNKFG